MSDIWGSAEAVSSGSPIHDVARIGGMFMDGHVFEKVVVDPRGDRVEARYCLSNVSTLSYITQHFLDRCTFQHKQPYKSSIRKLRRGVDIIKFQYYIGAASDSKALGYIDVPFVFDGQEISMKFLVIDASESHLYDMMIGMDFLYSFDVTSRGVEFKLPHSRHVCSVCHMRTPKMSNCSVCKDVEYCSRACQKIDWKQHKLVCVPK
eukprot:TRINITY_DN27727_c0_g1_i1.p1 TRINITY_DN27727_c0_g1~~TRINITY_DN27727_c0_g1_i1.p1  ORF type:complete len:213 (+),score=11.97 TRINITY_DN27727_c0_g1_i1:23-640(+)